MSIFNKKQKTKEEVTVEKREIRSPRYIRTCPKYDMWTNHTRVDSDGYTHFKDYVFCTQCGLKLVEEEHKFYNSYCGNCGEYLVNKYKYCPKCGIKLVYE